MTEELVGGEKKVFNLLDSSLIATGTNGGGGDSNADGVGVVGGCAGFCGW